MFKLVKSITFAPQKKTKYIKILYISFFYSWHVTFLLWREWPIYMSKGQAHQCLMLSPVQINVSLTSSFHLQQALKTADNQPQSSLIGNVWLWWVFRYN